MDFKVGILFSRACCILQELLPIEENGEVMGERPKVTEAARYASEEHKDVIEVTVEFLASVKIIYYNV